MTSSSSNSRSLRFGKTTSMDTLVYPRSFGVTGCPKKSLFGPRYFDILREQSFPSQTMSPNMLKGPLLCLRRMWYFCPEIQHFTFVSLLVTFAVDFFWRDQYAYSLMNLGVVLPIHPTRQRKNFTKSSIEFFFEESKKKEETHYVVLHKTDREYLRRTQKTLRKVERPQRKKEGSRGKTLGFYGQKVH